MVYYSPIEDWQGRKQERPLALEILAYVQEREQAGFKLVFYWAVINEFRGRTHSTRRIRTYLDRLIGEGRLYKSDSFESNPLVSTKPFREE